MKCKIDVIFIIVVVSEVFSTLSDKKVGLQSCSVSGLCCYDHSDQLFLELVNN